MTKIYQEERCCAVCEEITTHDIEFDIATCIECEECFPIDEAEKEG